MPLDSLKIVLPAVIALLGTVATAFFGYRQWRRQQTITREQTFTNDRDAAYKRLWEMVEEFNVALRTQATAGRGDLQAKVLEMNSFLLKSSLYIEQKHRLQVNEYVNSLQRLDTLLRTSDAHDVEQDWNATAEGFSPEVLDRFQEIKNADAKVTALSTTLVKEFRDILRGRTKS